MNTVHGVIDLDDTCFGWVEWFIREVGEEPTQWGLKDGSILKMYPHRDEEELVELVRNPEGYEELAVIPEAADSIRWILQSFPLVEISYVSAAPIEAIMHRITAMGRHSFPLPGMHKGIKRVTHVGGHEEKERWLKEYTGNIDFLLDDSYRYLDVAKELGVVHRYLIDRPWNADSTGHKRVLSWNHFRNRVAKEVLLSRIG